MKATIFWIGQHKTSSQPCIGVKYNEGNFVCKRFIDVVSTEGYELNQEIDVPAAALM